MGWSKSREGRVEGQRTQRTRCREASVWKQFMLTYQCLPFVP